MFDRRHRRHAPFFDVQEGEHVLRLREAEETLVRMRAEGFAARETVLLNAMLEGYLRTGEHQRLREFLVDESVRGKVSLNVASINALVGSLVAVGDTAAAEHPLSLIHI